jgi:hypothetical protein
VSARSGGYLRSVTDPPRSPLPPAAIALSLSLSLSLALGADARAQDGAADAPFSFTSIASSGRTVAAELIDLDGDARTDLLQIAFVGFPPKEKRRIRIYLQGPDGELPATPTRELELPKGTAAYDFADLSPAPGVEVILLRADDVLLLSLGRDGAQERAIRLSRPTIGAAEDERGMDRLQLARNGFGREPWLLVPQPGRAVALTGAGELIAELDVGARANYIIPPRPGPLLFESEVQAFVDAPRISVAEVNGDGRPDLIASSRHQVRVFPQRQDGRFASEPERTIPLARVSEGDHIRASGTVRLDATDVDADGLADVLVSHVSGALTDTRTTTTIHKNRGGSWDLAKADQRFESVGAWTTDELLDLDGDGRPELVRVGIPFSVLELVEMLVTRELDADIQVYRPAEGALFGAEPWAQRTIGVPLSFETFRPPGFIPTLEFDVNGDGFRDLVTSGGGDRIDVYLGGPEHMLQERDARVRIDSRGRLRTGDLDGDGLADLLIYDPTRADAPVLVARNNGLLPGSPRRPTLRPAEKEESE